MKKVKAGEVLIESGGELHVPSLSRSELEKQIQKRKRDLAKLESMGIPMVGPADELRQSLVMLEFFLAKKDEKK